MSQIKQEEAVHIFCALGMTIGIMVPVISTRMITDIIVMSAENM
jgi:hypothetical protein